MITVSSRDIHFETGEIFTSLSNQEIPPRSHSFCVLCRQKIKKIYQIDFIEKFILSSHRSDQVLPTLIWKQNDDNLFTFLGG